MELDDKLLNSYPLAVNSGATSKENGQDIKAGERITAICVRLVHGLISSHYAIRCAYNKYEIGKSIFSQKTPSYMRGTLRINPPSTTLNVNHTVHKQTY